MPRKRRVNTGGKKVSTGLGITAPPPRAIAVGSKTSLLIFFAVATFLSAYLWIISQGPDHSKRETDLCSLLPGCKEVQRIDWKDASGSFAPMLAKRVTPVVLTNTFVSKWPAVTMTAQAMSNRAKNGSMHSIYTRGRADHVFPYWHQKPLGQLPELQGIAQINSAVNVMHSIGSDAFFQHAFPESDCHRYRTGCQPELSTHSYYSNDLGQDFLSLLPELPRLSLLSPTLSLNASAVKLWIGPRGTITPTHNDAFHNVFVQIKGSKKFLMFPPSLHRHLHIYPALHPMHQQSQIRINKTNLQQNDRYPNFKLWSESGQSSPLHVSLQAGEVLYIPPMWYHRVQATSPSASLNVWTPVAARQRTEAAFAAADPLALGCLSGTTKSERAGSARSYLVSLLGAVLSTDAEADDGDARAKAFVRDVVVESRYQPLWSAGTLPSLPKRHVRMHCARHVTPPGMCMNVCFVCNVLSYFSLTHTSANPFSHTYTSTHIHARAHTPPCRH